MMRISIKQKGVICMSDSIKTLRALPTIRERSTQIYDLALAGQTHFACHNEKLGEVADFVIEVTRDLYPDFDIPNHCRLNHLNAGGVDRTSHLDGKALFNLVFLSVLLDAGAGDQWSLESDGVRYARSEGLGVASVRLVNEQLVDVDFLENLSMADFNRAFAISAKNPLVGAEQRLALLHRLGQVLKANGLTRPVDMLDAYDKCINIPDLFSQLLHLFSPIWPSRLQMDGEPLGDVWAHPAIGYVPFHKLTQWLSYSLIGPLAKMGFEIEGTQMLTGLPEYRNGGLLLDSGLISLRDPNRATQPYEVSDPLIIEWRALTVVYLDKIAQVMRDKLTLDQTSFPLAKVLEGGTWNAGRRLAQSRGGLPPLQLISDGTVF